MVRFLRIPLQMNREGAGDGTTPFARCFSHSKYVRWLFVFRRVEFGLVFYEMVQPQPLL